MYVSVSLSELLSVWKASTTGWFPMHSVSSRFGGLLYNNRYHQFYDRTCFTIARRKVVERIGRVAERLMAADCKSAAPCGLRRFESSPVHQNCKSFGPL